MVLSCMVLKAQLNASDIDLTSLGQGYSKVFNSNIPIPQKFSNAKQWIAKTFGDYKSVLQYEDEANAKIIIKGKCPLGSYYNISEELLSDKDDVKMSFTLTLDFKEDRYRAKMEDLVAEIDNTFKVMFLDNTFKVMFSPTYKHKTEPITTFCKNDDSKIDTLIEENNNELDTLQNRLSTEKLKKKEINLINEDIKNLKDTNEMLRNKKAVAFMHRYDTQRAISQLLNSLYKDINTNDDF